MDELTDCREVMIKMGILRLFPEGISYRVKLLLFLDDGPRSLAEFKEHFLKEWTKASRYLYEALVSGLVTLKVQNSSVDTWPGRGIPERTLDKIALMIMSPDNLKSEIDDSQVFFYLTEKGLNFLVDYHSKEYWKWGTLMSILIAVISLVVSLFK